MKEKILLTGEANIRYETGFYTTARRPKQIGLTAVIKSDSTLCFLAPEKWKTQILEQVPEQAQNLTTYGNSPELFLKALGDCLEEGGLDTLWIEYDKIDLKTYLYLKERFANAEFQDITRKMEQRRLVKTREEIAGIRHAASVAVLAMEQAKKVIRPGLSELELAAELEYVMRKAGSDGVPFTMKALSGENTETVTRVPGNRKLQRGDFVLLDFGAICDGYSSDWTRTFVIGEASPQQKELHDLVWKMERGCIEMIRPGIPMADLVHKAEEISSQHPFGKYYNPHLGHSIGITSHEWPTIEPGVTGVLQENMVITIEPGVYVPGLGGVRIEDEILVTKDGYEVLTGLSKEDYIV